MRLGRFGGGIAAILVLAACHTEQQPASLASNPLSSGVIVVALPPSPTPSNVPAPAPSPSSVPDTAPRPAEPPPGTSEPVSGSCRLPPGSGSGIDCPRQSPSFQAELESSMDALLREQPALFRADGCALCFRVVDERGYVDGLIEQLGRRGLCAQWDGGEIAIKRTNAFSDQYQVLSSARFMRRGDKIYRATCHPAWF